MINFITDFDNKLYLYCIFSIYIYSLSSSENVPFISFFLIDTKGILRLINKIISKSEYKLSIKLGYVYSQ